MPGRVQDTKLLQNLPKVSFRKIDDPALSRPSGVHGQQNRSYGFNSFQEFERPEHYIRHIEPIESELACQVEYDMDEQDKEWVDAINIERKKDPGDEVTYEVFEIIMDRLEKEWFDLMKHVPKTDTALPYEDSTCAICDDGEGENSNAIVFCDGCNLAVHQDCYGVPYIPEGQWLCRKCTVSPENPVSCMLCPNEGGAFKQTATGKWTHLLCAIWIPEVTVGNQVFMEPVEQINMIPKSRWKLHCSLCRNKHGACIQCDNRSCFQAFHVTCARSAKLLAAMKSLPGSEDGHLRAFCEKHLPQEMRDLRSPLNSPSLPRAPKSSKTARAYAKTYRLGPPLVPNIIVERILAYIQKMTLRKKPLFVVNVCKYWSLKREARRGAPLLKRLHLEPWTASGSTRQQTDDEKARRLEHLVRLRKDLEHVRMLAELAKKREKEKLKQQQILRSVISAVLFPGQDMLRENLDAVSALDRTNLFLSPVSKTDAPDYLDVVKTPMYWEKISDKLEDHAYMDIDSYKRDVNLIFENSMLYNRPNNPYHRAASRFLTTAQPILDKLTPLTTTPSHAVSQDQTSMPPAVGDLEAPLPILRLLLSTADIQSSVDLVLDSDPITSLFSFELETPKPLPPPPPPKSSKSNRRPSKAELRTQRAERDRQRKLDIAAGIRAPVTRRTRASDAGQGSIALEGAPEGAGDASQAHSESEAPKPSPVLEQNKRQKERENRKLRRLAIEAELSAVPLIVEPDKRDSFKMFNQGWMLPAGTKRGGRVPIERAFIPPPPPRPRKKKGQNEPSPEAVDADNQDVEPTATDQEESEASARVGPSTDETEAEHPPDDPNSNQSAQVELDAEVPTSPSYAHGGEEELGSSPLSPVDDDEDEPPSSGLSEPETTPAVAARRRPPRRVRKIGKAKKRAKPKPKPNGKQDPFAEGGTLVWAKVVSSESYPWFPAVVFEDDDDEVPKHVVGGRRPAEAFYSPGPVHLVRFYDDTWSWLPVSKLKPLGEDKAVDEHFLAAKATEKMRIARRKAYRDAIAEMETEEEQGVQTA